MISEIKMIELDIDFVRSQFPAFSEPSLESFAHFENAGGTYACKQVVNAISSFYLKTKVQPYYDFEPSRAAGNQMNDARRRMAEWLNADSEEVHFGPSTSQNTYVIAQALKEYLNPGDEIIVTNQDHEANIGVWRRLQDRGIVIKEWKVDPNQCELGTQRLKALLTKKTRVVTFTHCSNIVGSINPVREWAKIIKDAGAIVIVDGVSYAGHGLPDMKNLGVDIYFFSLYKVYGPHIGVMFIRNSVNELLPNQGHFFNEDSPINRFTPAGPDHAQIASINGILDYFETIHTHHYGDEPEDPKVKSERVCALFNSAERTNLEYLLDFFKQKRGVNIIGKKIPANRAPTVSFTVDHEQPVNITRDLAQQNIGIANGNCYAYRLMETLGIPPDEGVNRISFVHYTNTKEINRLINALDEIL